MWSVKATGRISLFVSLVTFSTVIYVNIYNNGTNKSFNHSSSFLSAMRSSVFANESLNTGGAENSHGLGDGQRNYTVSDHLERPRIQNVIMNNVKETLNTNYTLEHIVKLDPGVYAILKQLKLGNLQLNINHTVAELSLITELLKSIVDKTFKEEGVSSNKSKVPRPLLTLFTTWTNNPSKYDVHNATVRNWASLRPAIQPVLFSNDINMSNQVKAYGWKVLNISKTADNGLPVLKTMYMDAKRMFDSVFYGYANSDILFTGHLHKTISAILYSDYFRLSKHVLISGVRTNIVNFTESEIQTKQDLRKSASDRGTFFQTSAEDYFITDKDYPWEDLPEVIVGSMAYDNWLVADARNRLFTTIDITATSLAVHISHESDHYQSHSRNWASYNKDLLAKLFGDNVNYHRGFTDCMAIGTAIQNDTVVFVERTQFAFYC